MIEMGYATAGRGNTTSEVFVGTMDVGTKVVPSCIVLGALGTQLQSSQFRQPRLREEVSSRGERSALELPALRDYRAPAPVAVDLQSHQRTLGR